MAWFKKSNDKSCCDIKIEEVKDDKACCEENNNGANGEKDACCAG